MVEHKSLLWKKIATRHLSFLFMDYVLTSYLVMEKEVGTTLHYNLAVGEGNLITVYRVPDDVEHSYQLVRDVVVNNPQRILAFMDNFERLVADVHKLILTIQETADKDILGQLLVQFDKSIELFMCYQLFFVYIGYAAHIPEISEFLKEHGKRVEKLRMSTLYQELDRSFQGIFGMYDGCLGDSCNFMTRKEIINHITSGENVDLQIVKERKKRYLRIMRNFHVVDYPLEQIDAVLATELSHITVDRTQKELIGSGVYRGLAKGKVCVVLSHHDYQKITPQNILVTPMTVPDMVPYLSRVRGIVTNDGGTLCHASIVAREMKIPTIVGTGYATDIFKDGDLVEVDATNGVVRKLK